MSDTAKQYDEVLNQCRDLFTKKMRDYGSAWRILRLPSLTDQIFIKAQRIRSLQQNNERRVDEGEVSEFIGIINYCTMALIQIKKGVVEHPDVNLDQASTLYDQELQRTKNLMLDNIHSLSVMTVLQNNSHSFRNRKFLYRKSVVPKWNRSASHNISAYLSFGFWGIFVAAI